ncbi:serine/threonine-protein kinase [Lotmaria passim]
MTDADLKKPNNGGNGLPMPPSNNESAQDPLQGILGRGPECKYVKKRLLGQGSFGSAWRVEESATGKMFAAKVMDLNSMSEKDRGFVTNEVKCLSRCNNPHIVRCEDAVEKGGQLLIVMEYADGGDLYKQIKARVASMKYFREHEVIFIFLQLCLALDHIHSNKMMHRDLKTANILLTTTGLVKLGDFGFSRQYEDSLSNAVGSTFCGTPYYLSPELWHRQPYSKKSEMWALGVVLYEVMALKRPFTGKNMDELITNICHGRRSELPSRYSEGLCDVCNRLLSVDPNQRPTIQELFHEPFIRTSLETLKRSVEKHTRIPADVREAISRCIDQSLSHDVAPVDADVPRPLTGTVKRHTALRGWQPCQLSFDGKQVSIRDPSGADPEETVPVSTLTSVCPIDVMMAGEEFVFAMKNQAGKAFWFKAPGAKTYEEWLTTLQNAAP